MNNAHTQNIHLITLNPGHFHAALLQKVMYPQVSPAVHVYAPEGPDLKSHLKLVNSYNSRTDNPTRWEQKVYTGADYLERMLSEKKGNVVVLSGNNQKKTEYLKASVDAGFNVLADKPMAIDSQDFALLQDAFSSAEKKKVILYDIMTERFEITNILQKELSQQPDVFGTLQRGTPENPSIIKESVHYYYKNVSGVPLVRPAWFFDVEQAGNGIVDVTTHMVDLIQWGCFPGVTFDYKKDINMLSAKRWPTKISLEQFKQATQREDYPEYLTKEIKDGALTVFANGEMNYTIKDIHARISVVWDFQAPPGGSDTHMSTIRGTKANIVIRQGKEQGYKPTLYIEPLATSGDYQSGLNLAIKNIQAKYPGIELKKVSNGWEVLIPGSYKTGHEAHFAEVTRNYLKYVEQGKLPQWEVPNMLSKYYTTTQALEKAMGR